MTITTKYELAENLKVEVDGRLVTGQVTLVAVREGLDGTHVVNYELMAQWSYPENIAKKIGRTSDERLVFATEAELEQTNQMKGKK